jgi:lysophospholipase L1-like esterase
MRFTGTWATSPQPLDHPPVENTTFRMTARCSLAGGTLRARFSNGHGTHPMGIANASIALRKGEAGIDASSRRALTFGGEGHATIAEGALLLSDPVDFDLPALADVMVTFHVPGRVAVSSGHGGARQTSYFAKGDHAAANDLPAVEKIDSWFFLNGIEVASTAGTRGIVAFGDSLTDANVSTPNAYCRWPDQLARRLTAERGSSFAGVMNMGTGGNRILHDNANSWCGLRRFDRDIAAAPGATHLIVVLGTNDLRNRRAVEAEEANAPAMIAGLKQLAARAKAVGVKPIVATLMPYENEIFVPGCWNPAREKVRLAVNEWIRAQKDFDAVVDLERALRDPANPSKLLPKWDCGDHLHPSDAGYNHMGDSIDLRLFD